MHIQSIGRGPNISLIHGWAMHGGIFHELTERLSERCRVHVIDLPGHGESRAPESGFELQDLVDRLERLLPPSIWVGWSLGGLIAMRAAAAGSAALRGLALIGASPRFVVDADWPHAVPLAVFQQFHDDLQSDYDAALERFLALEMHGDENAQQGLRDLKAHIFERGRPDPAVLERGLALLERTDLREQVSRIAVPNVWIAGSRDRLVPSPALEWGARIAGGRFVSIAKAGHAPFLTHRAQVLEALFALVTEVEVG